MYGGYTATVTAWGCTTAMAIFYFYPVIFMDMYSPLEFCSCYAKSFLSRPYQRFFCRSPVMNHIRVQKWVVWHMYACLYGFGWICTYVCACAYICVLVCTCELYAVPLSTCQKQPLLEDENRHSSITIVCSRWVGTDRLFQKWYFRNVPPTLDRMRQSCAPSFLLR